MVGISDIPIMNHKLAVSNYRYRSLCAEKARVSLQKQLALQKKGMILWPKSMLQHETTKPSSIPRLFATFVKGMVFFKP